MENLADYVEIREINKKDNKLNSNFCFIYNITNDICKLSNNFEFNFYKGFIYIKTISRKEFPLTGIFYYEFTLLR